MLTLKKIFFHSPFRYLIALAIATSITLIYLFTRGFKILFYYLDAFSIAGAVTFLIGCLSLVTFLGGFDTFGYGFSSMRRGANRKYEDLYDYQTKKRELRKTKKWTFVPYMVVGIIFLLVALIISFFL